MPQYQAITKRLALNTLATLVGATITLLSACQDLEPAPEPAPTRVKQPPTPLAPATPATQQPDFAFVFSWSSCGSYTLDTSYNKLTLETNMSPSVTSTVGIMLSQQELSTIFQKMADIELYNYPDEFSIQLPPDVIRIYSIPALYRFDVRNGGQRKVVAWNDAFSEPENMPWKAEDSEPSRTQATRLKELIKLVRQIVEKHPEFRELPEPGGCA